MHFIDDYADNEVQAFLVKVFSRKREVTSSKHALKKNPQTC